MEYHTILSLRLHFFISKETDIISIHIIIQVHEVHKFTIQVPKINYEREELEHIFLIPIPMLKTTIIYSVCMCVCV